MYRAEGRVLEGIYDEKFTRRLDDRQMVEFQSAVGIFAADGKGDGDGRGKGKRV